MESRQNERLAPLLGFTWWRGFFLALLRLAGIINAMDGGKPLSLLASKNQLNDAQIATASISFYRPPETPEK